MMYLKISSRRLEKLLRRRLEDAIKFALFIKGLFLSGTLPCFIFFSFS